MRCDVEPAPIQRGHESRGYLQNSRECPKNDDARQSTALSANSWRATTASAVAANHAATSVAIITALRHGRSQYLSAAPRR